MAGQYGNIAMCPPGHVPTPSYLRSAGAGYPSACPLQGPNMWGGGGGPPGSHQAQPPQARARKQRPPGSMPKRKVGVDGKYYTTLSDYPKISTREDAKRMTGACTTAEDEIYDTFTMNFGTKPGSNKPPRMIITLKSPKVLDAKMTCNEAGTQVRDADLNLFRSRPSRKSSRKSLRSRKSKKSVTTRKSKKSIRVKKRSTVTTKKFSVPVKKRYL